MIEREDYSDVGTLDAEDQPSTAISVPGPPTPTPLAPEAFRGPLGEFVAAIRPHSEADPVALLIQALAVFGSRIGRTAHVVADGHQHFGNIFTVLVAKSSKGRKGTSWQRVRRLFDEIDPDWRPVNGLASGEGLIHHLRDNGEAVDKRLLVVESEFARVLQAGNREGSTLSQILRAAWDESSFRVLTRKDPVEATDAHISLIGHITSDELRLKLSGSDAVNGFGNRILWVHCDRFQILADGGQPDPQALANAGGRIQHAMMVARGRGEMRRTEDAAEFWREIYPDLSEGRPGLAGSVTSRAEAHVVRLSLLYALADGSQAITVNHIKAGLLLWRYCEASARYVFGESLGHRGADDILAALRQAGGEGLSRTELNRDVFGRNKGAAAINEALRLLMQANLITGRRVASGLGRPVERFFARPE